ncbi:MAG: NADH dehydrogenase subunit J [Candidatus Methanohalarchaeum thermophilum]|uniref:NADH dehydrogenase subunit J n=1 Tax=Methanohalarchaeum thermophilum TaxID=1903181 RepID=A0A1Q6DX81_METT1|nr:MAG: NADH dehydrogenase subunit J [Candidatus Methanohalarchaeum thermophilum]
MQSLMLIISFLVLISALMVILSEDMVHSALFLIFSFGGVGALFLSVGAQFLGAIQILIYTGAVGVMMLLMIYFTSKEGKSIKREGKYSGIVLVGLLGFLILYPSISITREVGGTKGLTQNIGRLLFSDLLIPFEVISIVLLSAIIGATYIIRREDH